MDVRSPFATLEDNLRRYLPEQLIHPLLNQPSLVTARSCEAHLDALLRNPKPGQLSGQFREATIMFADISGLTATSERLSRRGEQGAEKGHQYRRRLFHHHA